MWRGPGTLQLGLGGRDCLVLSGITDDDLAFLDLLAVGVSDSAVVGGTVPPGPARCRHLLEHLSSARLLLTQTAPDAARPVAGAARARLEPDAVTWSWVPGADPLSVGDGWDLVAGRAGQTVQVHGLGRTGWAIASTLGACGVRVVGHDPRPVTEADLAPCGPGPADVGDSREAAFARSWPAAAPDRGTSARARSRGRSQAPDLVVLVDHAAADTVGADGLLSADLAHLSVVVGEARTTVGPLVVPGRTACLRCLDLHRTERDPAWPTVSAQLAHRGLRAGLAVDSTSPFAVEETLLSTAAAALASAQVLAHLDGRPAPAVGATLDLALPDLFPARRGWTMHPGCGCAGIGAVGGPANSSRTATMLE